MSAQSDQPSAVGPAHLVIRSARCTDAARLAILLSLGALDASTEDPADQAPYRRALAEIDAADRNKVLIADCNGLVIGVCQVFAVQHLQARG